MDIPLDFPEAVLAEVEQVAAAASPGPAPRPAPSPAGLADADPDAAATDLAATDLAATDLAATPPRPVLDISFVTIDPPGSMDLDQALHIERVPTSGYLVHYAIADVAHFVRPGGAIDKEVATRGMTLYAPDGRTPLHPPVLSEGAASLLPGVDRPAAVWRIVLDERGEITDVDVRRAQVRSAQRLTYDEVQTAVDDGTASEVLLLLREVGELRQARERERGGVSLNVPEQNVTLRDDGSYGLEFRSVLPAEGWNAQISLLTGIAAARVMRAGGIGIFRTLPASDPSDVERLRRTARALAIAWSTDQTYGDLLASLDSTVPQHAAFLNEATSLFRGAGYLTFDGEAPTDAEHAAIASEYAHVTAPLRRLVDRYGTEICLALCAGEDVPAWVREAFPMLPKAMSRAGQRASAFERASVDIVEAALLTGSEGAVFHGVIVDLDAKDPGKGVVVVDDPAVRGTVRSTAGPLPLGESVTVRVSEVSIEDRVVRFSYGES